MDLTPANLDECTFVTAPGGSILYEALTLAIRLARDDHAPSESLNGWWMEFRQRIVADLVDGYQLQVLARSFGLPVVYTGVDSDRDWLAIIHPPHGTPVAVHSYDPLVRR